MAVVGLALLSRTVALRVVDVAVRIIVVLIAAVDVLELVVAEVLMVGLVGVVVV